MTSAGHIDLYQLTSLIPHFDAGLTDQRVEMAFFSRRLPRHVHTGEPARGYLLWAGLHRCLDHLEGAHFTEEQLERLLAHPMLGPALRQRPVLLHKLQNWRFAGHIRAPAEGTPLLAGPALTPEGQPLAIDGVSPAAYCPFLVVETDLLSAKLIETPLLSLINHMSMVATKASMVVEAARKAGPNRIVLEFGQRRTHPEAAVDAALAAYIGGCAGTSNVEAWLRHGVPISGTMDHFAIQAWERPGVPVHETETAYFAAFHAQWPDRDTLLVDTYDTFGARTGIRAAVAATGAGPFGIRIDSNVSRDTILRARALLDSLGATHTRIYVSGGMDEHAIAELGDAPVDGYGIGERIVTSADSPVGVGAVGKLTRVDGRPTMKLSRGSSKATLPGQLQVWRQDDGDVVGLEGEHLPGRRLLETVWDWRHGRLAAADPSAARDRARAALDAWPEERKRPRSEALHVSPGLYALIHELVRRPETP